MKKFFTAAAMFITAITSFAQDLTQVITEKPDGKEYVLYGKTSGCTEFWGQMFPYELDGSATSVVFAEDGTVYLYNPISGYNAKTWIKGKLDPENNIVTFTLPQTIEKEEILDENGTAYTDYIIGYKMSYSEELNTYLVTPADQELQYTWDGKELKMLDDQFIGIASPDGSWHGIGDKAQAYNVMEDKTVAPKDENNVISYMMKYNTKENIEATQPIFVKVEGEDVYVRGMSKSVSGAWIKGKLNGENVTFAGKQYLGIDTDMASHNYFMPLDKDTPKESVTLSFNATDMTMTTSELLTINYGKNTVKTLEYFSEPMFFPWEDPKQAPAAPVIKECNPENGDYSSFTFSLPMKTEDGIYLDAQKLYYNIYYDDELFTFTTSPYGTFDKDMTDVPYDYTDQDYFITKAGNDRIIYTFKKGFKKLGVQCFYLDGENKLKSKMAEWSNPTGIENVAAEDGTVTWTDISGRAVNKPANGIFIKTVKNTDGTTTVSKHVFK